jgi:hypothetical protein
MQNFPAPGNYYLPATSDTRRNFFIFKELWIGMADATRKGRRSGA